MSNTLTLPLASVEELPPLKFGNRFTSLPPEFYTTLQPTPLPDPVLVGVSASAAELIGLDPKAFEHQAYVECFTGNRIIPGSKPLAAVYSGHQFGAWAGQLGDGRAILLGDVPAASQEASWARIELQLKGSGLTPYSRMGDGRAVLRSSIREFLCSEAMHALGIPTSRALCVTGSQQHVMREAPEPTAVVTRMAPSFVRFGSFEHWSYQDNHDQLKLLADYVIEHDFPHLKDETHPYRSLLQEVSLRTARLIAQWQSVGFMHGVMNTDNMSILGLTLDYGPFGFMEAFDANHICNHSDHQGRYSYAMQPRIGHWNCYALGQAMLPLLGDVDQAHAAISSYGQEYGQTLDKLLHAKLGLAQTLEGDDAFIDSTFQLLQTHQVDFTLFFRNLGQIRIADQKHDGRDDSEVRDLFIDRPAFDAWCDIYRARLHLENSNDEQRHASMCAVNPKYVLRNYLAQIAIEKAHQGDFSEVKQLLNVLNSPYEEQPEHEIYAKLPPDWANSLQVSCSS